MKKCGLLKIIHDKHKKPGRNVHPCTSEFLDSFQQAKAHNSEFESLLPKTQVRLATQSLRVRD